LNETVPNRNCAIDNNAEFPKLEAAAGTCRSGDRNELAGMNDI
jgi:hypothetical protein